MIYSITEPLTVSVLIATFEFTRHRLCLELFVGGLHDKRTMMMVTIDRSSNAGNDTRVSIYET